jgi:chromatin segregation and condensation protein Rec8/ScpA/Scc1 (kleisin family)
MVLIFLSILELVKELVIRFRQSGTFGDIIIVKLET